MNHVLIFVICLSHSISVLSLTIISGTWNDDFIGWQMSGTETATDTTTNGIVEYHGPYPGNTAGDGLDVYILSNTFQCATNSTVEVIFSDYFACTNDGREIGIKIDAGTYGSNTQTITVMNGVSPTWTDPALSTAHSACSTGWEYHATDGPFILSNIPKYADFTLTLTMSTPYTEEAIAISDIVINCGSITSSPTTNIEPDIKQQDKLNIDMVMNDVGGLNEDDDDQKIDDKEIIIKSGGAEPKSFVISLKCVKLSKFVATVLECDNDASIVEIKQVPPETLQHVVTYLNHHKGKEPDPLPCPVRSIDMKQIVSDKWDATWIDAFDKKTIFEIILAANYMDIESLLHLGCAKIATLIKQLDEKEINRIIEEEEKYRREHAVNIEEEDD